jgi:hypothetical protein
MKPMAHISHLPLISHSSLWWLAVRYFIIRAASECQALLGDNMSYPVEVSAKFVRPVVLPGTTHHPNPIYPYTCI